MPIHASAFAARFVLHPLPRSRLWPSLQRACASIGAYAAHWRDAYTAALLYEELRQLSDAELRRRGTPRSTLHRQVFRAAAG